MRPAALSDLLLLLLLLGLLCPPETDAESVQSALFIEWAPAVLRCCHSHPCRLHAARTIARHPTALNRTESNLNPQTPITRWRWR
jgi:hypothetical protein